MRAYELHACAKQIQRSHGRSAVAAAAYRAGACLEDERTGLIHDYRRKQGVELTRLYAPEGAADFTRDRGALWNAAEWKENRSNSCTARELEVGFPAEFNAMQRREAGDALARELMRRYGCAVDIAYHRPDRQGDERNHHAHILFTTRALDGSAKDGWAKKKYRDFNNDKVTVDGEATTRGKQEILSLRAFIADEMNRIAARDALKVKTEHLSFEARGIAREPTQKLGPAASQMERRGEETERGDINREIAASNDNRQKLIAEKTAIEAELARIERELGEEEERERIDAQRRAEIKRQEEQARLLQKSRMEQARHARRAVFHSRYLAAQSERQRKEDEARRALEREQQSRDGAHIQAFEQERARLQDRLAKQGFVKTMRDITGITARDRAAMEAAESALALLRQKQAEELAVLRAAQDRERENLERDWQKKRAALEAELAREAKARRIAEAPDTPSSLENLRARYERAEAGPPPSHQERIEAFKKAMKDKRAGLDRGQEPERKPDKSPGPDRER